jgi:hypothetical protein
MTFTSLRRARRHLAVITVLAAAVVVPAVASSAPAAASLSSADWIEQTLPANFQIWQGATPIDPVSCVPGSEFCVVLATDLANTEPSFQAGYGALVTTDGGASWKSYPVLPGVDIYVTSLSCFSSTDCWTAGSGPDDQPEVAQSTDGGQTWTLMTPPDWANNGPSWWPNSIDCVTATTCWLAGMTANSIQAPVVANTTDGGATWKVFNNLPTFTPYDPNGTYLLNGISCTSELSCVAVGGLNEADGRAQVVATTDGGATWSLSPDPTLNGMQALFGVQCIPVPGNLATCHAAADALEAAGPVAVTSTDGGITWHGVETVDNTGWLDTISCSDVQHCWAGGAETTVSLAGTTDGGSTWTAVSADVLNDNSQVSCATTNICVATTDNGLWVTTDGGLAAPLATMTTRPAARQVTIALPKVNGSTAYARAGSTATITGQYRGTTAASKVTVTITSPSGHRTSTSVPVGLNNFYSYKIGKVALGSTTVSFAAGNAKTFVVHLHGHPGPAPAVSRLSSHAGPAAGGARVTVTGANFSGVTAVWFGSHKATSIKVISKTQLKATAPAGTAARLVRVLTSGGGLSALTGRALYNYLPVPALRKLRPSSGPGAGGNVVTITGSGFGYLKAVYFGSRPATKIKVISPTLMTVVGPGGSGTVNVRVRTAGGTTPVTSADKYSYTG